MHICIMLWLQIICRYSIRYYMYARNILLILYLLCFIFDTVTKDNYLKTINQISFIHIENYIFVSSPSFSSLV